MIEGCGCSAGLGAGGGGEAWEVVYMRSPVRYRVSAPRH